MENLMKARETIKLCGGEHCQPYCHDAQADITFPLGEKEGIKKVVEWIEDNRLMGYIMNPNNPILSAWENQLKEWGIG